MELLKSLVVILAAYCLGSISFAYVVGRLAKGIDMTDVGNGRIGASFSIQRMGRGWGVLVGFLDFMKGAAAMGLALALNVPAAVAVLAGLAVVAGHNWSVFLGFRGGRGAAASFGVLSALATVPSLITVVVLLPIFLATRRWQLWLGIRRTTLMFGVSMLVVAIVIWEVIVSGVVPASLWTQQMSPSVIVLPVALLALNVIKRPWHPAVDAFLAELKAGRR